MFITFEGLDKSGKSTQVKMLSDYFNVENIDHIVVRDPGGTEIGETLRDIVLHNNTTTPKTDLFLFLASRNLLVNQKIIPALNAGKVVISDRFIDSTLYYQGILRGKNLGRIWNYALDSADDTIPDITFFIQTPYSIIKERLQQEKYERYNEQFVNDVYEWIRSERFEYFNRRHKKLMDRAFYILDGKLPAENIHKVIVSIIEKKIRGH